MEDPERAKAAAEKRWKDAREDRQKQKPGSPGYEYRKVVIDRIVAKLVELPCPPTQIQVVKAIEKYVAKHWDDAPDRSTTKRWAKEALRRAAQRRGEGS
jgi:hypothetical protein